MTSDEILKYVEVRFSENLCYSEGGLRDSMEGFAKIIYKLVAERDAARDLLDEVAKWCKQEYHPYCDIDAGCPFVDSVEAERGCCACIQAAVERRVKK